jgi:hypothetical protein
VTFPNAGPGESLSAVAVRALLGTGRALRDVANRLFHILPCKRLLSRSLSFDAFVLLPVPTGDVSLPEVQRARLLPLKIVWPGAGHLSLSGDIPKHWPSPGWTSIPSQFF